MSDTNASSVVEILEDARQQIVLAVSKVKSVLPRVEDLDESLKISSATCDLLRSVQSISKCIPQLAEVDVIEAGYRR